MSFDLDRCARSSSDLAGPRRETHTLPDELAEATLDGTRKECIGFLETVPLLIIDDLGMRKLPLTAAEELLEIASCGDMNGPVRC